MITRTTRRVQDLETELIGLRDTLRAMRIDIIEQRNRTPTLAYKEFFNLIGWYDGRTNIDSRVSTISYKEAIDALCLHLGVDIKIVNEKKRVGVVSTKAKKKKHKKVKKLNKRGKK